MAFYVLMHCYAPNPLHTFPCKFPGDGEAANLLQTCCGLVSNMANESPTSRCNGIWETTRHNGHNGLLPVPTCCGLATGKSPTFYGLAMEKLV